MLMKKKKQHTFNKKQNGFVQNLTHIRNPTLKLEYHHAWLLVTIKK